MSNVAKNYVTYSGGGFHNTTTSNDSVLFANVGATTITIGLVVLSIISSKLDFAGTVLTNLGAPTASSDAATKTYTDTADNLRVLKAGDTLTGSLTFTSGTVTGLPAPSAASDAVPKSYADAIMVAARIQENVRVATTGANINLASAPTTIDGVTLAAGDRVLVKDQTSSLANGIYDFNGAAAAMTRDASLNNTPGNDIYNGVLVPQVESGTVNAGKAFVISSVGTGTGGAHVIGTDNINWTQFATPANYTAGAGIWFNGSAVTANPDGVTLDASGATANGSATLEVKTGGIGTTQLADLSVTTAKIAAQAVTSAQLGAVTGAGLSGGAGSVITVNVDGVTLDTAGAGSSLEVKALGVGTAQLAAQAVTAAKLGAVAGSGLTGGLGANIAVSGGDGITVSASVAVNYSETLTNDNAGSVTAGQLVYLKSNGHVDLATAVVAGPDTQLMVVLSGTVATTASGSFYARPGARMTGFTSLTPGKKVYAHNSTAGSYTQDDTTIASGNYVHSIGRAISATDVIYNPQFIVQA